MNDTGTTAPVTAPSQLRYRRTSRRPGPKRHPRRCYLTNVALPLRVGAPDDKGEPKRSTPRYCSVCRRRPARVDRYPHTSYLHIPHSFGRAACVVGDQAEAHAQPVDGPEQAPQPIGLHVLRARAGITFSGNTGVPSWRQASQASRRRPPTSSSMTSPRSSRSSRTRALRRSL